MSKTVGDDNTMQHTCRTVSRATSMSHAWHQQAAQHHKTLTKLCIIPLPLWNGLGLGLARGMVGWYGSGLLPMVVVHVIIPPPFYGTIGLLPLGVWSLPSPLSLEQGPSAQARPAARNHSQRSHNRKPEGGRWRMIRASAASQSGEPHRSRDRGTICKEKRATSNFVVW